MTHYVKISGTKFNDVLAGSGLSEKIYGKKGNDVINAGAGADKIKGGAGNDVITGGRGNDDIDGGSGTDVAVYSGLIQQYALSFKDNSNLKGIVTDLVAGRDGTDTLKSVEFLQFANAIYDVENDTVYLLNSAPVLAAIPAVTFSDTASDDTFTAASGTLSASDADNDTLSYAISGGAPDGSLMGFDLSKSSAYGTLYLNSATGAYRFVPNDSAIEALTAATSISFTFTVSDGALSDSKVFTVALSGVNDAPVVSGAVTGTATEDGAPSILDALAHVSDRDAGQMLSIVNVPALPAGVTYNAASHSFTLDPSNAAYQHVAKDASTTVTIGYAASDGAATTPASVSWTVTGINDAPVAHDKSDAATEGGATISGNVVATDADDGALLTYSLIGAAPAGLTFNGNGSYSFNPAAAAYDALAQDATQDVVATYQVSDGLATSTATLKITVHGLNDDASISGPTAGLVTEDDTLTAGGKLSVSDVDTGENSFQTPASLAGTYGTFSFDPNTGIWGYTLSNGAANVQALGGLELRHDTLLVSSIDGTANRTIDVSVHGANDAPVLQSAVPSGDPVLDENSLTLNAMMAFDDVDLLDTHSVTFTALTDGSIGTFMPTVATDSTSSGHGVIGLSYHLTKGEVEAVNGQFPDHQDYRVTIDDHHGGTRSQIVSIPLAQILSGIGGDQNNHDPVIYLNPAAGDRANGAVVDDVSHPNRQFAIGRLSFSDQETQQTHFASVIGMTPGPLGTLGTMFASVLRDTNGQIYTLGGSDPDGFLAASPIDGVLQWNYHVDENKIQPFGAGEFYTDRFQMMLSDNAGGFTTRDIFVNIAGVNDAPALAGDADLAVRTLYFAGTFSDTSPYPFVPGPYQTHGFGFIDPDRHDHHTVSATLDLAHSTVNVSATFEAHLTKETYLFGPCDTTGSLAWTYRLQDLAAPYLPGHEGQQRIQTWDIFIDDGHGGTHVPFVVTFNSAPALVSSDHTNPGVLLGGGYNNGPNSSAPVGFGQEGAFGVYDPDPNDHITMSAPVFDDVRSTVHPDTAFSAQLGSDGFVHWQQTILDSATPYLPGKDGLPRQQVYDITLTDEHGGVTTIPFTIAYNSSATIGTPTFDYLSGVDPAAPEFLGATTTGDTTVLRFDFSKPVADGLLFESFIIDGNLPFFDPDMDHHMATRQFIGEESTNGNASFGHLFADSIAVTEQGTVGQVHFQYGVTASFVPGEHVTDVFVVDLNDGSHHYFKFDMFAV